MATQNRDDSGQFGEKMRNQDILKAFDFEASADDPYLTVSEVRAALTEHWDIDVTDEAVRTRLEQMIEEETVQRRDFGPGVAYRALVGPRLDSDLEDELETTREDAWDDSTSIDDLDFDSQ
ncbi:helix-turn-helix domain-containing protein [Halorientalis salina]|uniref:helix-turn-helix domain-containing protein n=1 Tax=Halorientalis salina TaxID=2932266 RepID=UPI0010AC31EF|nr:helix-turn-helix domain-containing protein [Halorientalis salina]